MRSPRFLTTAAQQARQCPQVSLSGPASHFEQWPVLSAAEDVMGAG
jgi:hypothetical protein